VATEADLTACLLPQSLSALVEEKILVALPVDLWSGASSGWS
jgi:hypothetical protein